MFFFWLEVVGFFLVNGARTTLDSCNHTIHICCNQDSTQIAMIILTIYHHENLSSFQSLFLCFSERYVWEHLKLGYMQGMCDLVAPLLVIFDDESLTYSCFCLLMERMGSNFPHKGGAMDTHFANMR